jgi:dienelactone hydrolase
MRVLSIVMLPMLVLLMGVSVAAAAGGPVTYEVNGVKYEGYYADAGADAPLVLMIHDWDGLGDYEIKRSEMLVQLGYSVFAADLFGAGVRPEILEERRKQTEALYNDRPKMRTLMNAALQQAQSMGANVNNAVAMGYCFGGAAVLELARSGADLKAFVSFHGGLDTPEGQDYSATRGPVLVLHGTADTAVSMEDFAKLADAMESSGVKHEMITYSGAPHAFTVFDTDRYREDADKKSWQRFTAFLAETLK